MFHTHLCCYGACPCIDKSSNLDKVFCYWQIYFSSESSKHVESKAPSTSLAEISRFLTSMHSGSSNRVVKLYYIMLCQLLLFTALHAMQTRSSDEISVCLSVCLSVCPSVCLSNACIVTKRKKNLSRFLYHTKDHFV